MDGGVRARAGGRRGGAVRWGVGTRAKEGGARPEAGTEPGDDVEQANVGPQSTALAGEQQQQRCGARLAALLGSCRSSRGGKGAAVEGAMHGGATGEPTWWFSSGTEGRGSRRGERGDDAGHDERGTLMSTRRDRERATVAR